MPAKSKPTITTRTDHSSRTCSRHSCCFGRLPSRHVAGLALELPRRLLLRHLRRSHRSSSRSLRGLARRSLHPLPLSESPQSFCSSLAPHQPDLHRTPPARHRASPCWPASVMAFAARCTCVAFRTCPAPPRRIPAPRSRTSDRAPRTTRHTPRPPGAPTDHETIPNARSSRRNLGARRASRRLQHDGDVAPLWRHFTVHRHRSRNPPEVPDCPLDLIP